MALPGIEKVWQWDGLNRSVPLSGSNATTQAKKVFIEIKAGLLAFPTLPWTVVGSCNAVAFGLDGVDRLLTTTDIVTSSSGNRSWIVLRQPATGLQICVEFNASSAVDATFVLSPSAQFTGGALNARPTATDEIVMRDTSTSWLRSSLSNVDFTVHVWHSQLGKNTMVAVIRTSNLQLSSLWVFGEAGGATSGWTIPLIGFVRGGVSADVSPTMMVSNTDPIKARGPSGLMNLRAIIRATRHLTSGINGPDYSFNTLTAPNGFTSKYHVWPIGLLSMATGMKGCRGRIVDLWVGTVPPVSGSRYYETKGFRQFANFIFPWNETVSDVEGSVLCLCGPGGPS